MVTETLQLAKVPCHLSLLLRSVPTPRDGLLCLDAIMTCLADAILYLFSALPPARLHYLSVFDQKGILGSHAEDFLQLLITTCHIKDTSYRYFVERKPFEKAAQQQDPSRLMRYLLRRKHTITLVEQTLVLQYLSASDGKPWMQTLVDQRLFPLGSSAAVQTAMHACYGPEPELILVSGGGRKPLELDGYPPWQLRSAEIVTMSKETVFTLDQLEKGLDRYAHTQQRYGR